MVYIVFRKNKTKDKLHKKNKTKKRESERRERYNIIKKKNAWYKINFLGNALSILYDINIQVRIFLQQGIIYK